MHRSEFDRAPYAPRRPHGRLRARREPHHDFLRSRTVDHWIMFLAGVVVGMIVG